MPFRRVGAVDSTDNGGGKNSRAPLTIQDLKKQTAMRLAQEHHQSQGTYTGNVEAVHVFTNPRNNCPVVSPKTLAARRNNASHRSISQPGNGQHDYRDAAPLYYQRSQHHQLAHAVHGISNAVDAFGMGCGPPHYYDHSHKNARNMHSRSKQYHQHSSKPYGSLTAGSRFHPGQRSLHLSEAPSPNLPSNYTSSSNPSGSMELSLGRGTPESHASSQAQSISSNRKLCHGLTVYELKEMTKARLQAEAAENNPGGNIAHGTDSSRAFESVPSGYSQSMSPHTQQMQSQSALPGSSSYFRQPVQVSPPSPAFPIYQQIQFESASQYLNRAPGNRSRNDTYPESNWESASVTSHNSTVASDYLGSESAFAGHSQNGDDQSRISLPKAQSCPVVSSREGTPTSLLSPLPPSLYEDNRQRAMTLSPRPGLSLLHEDRPGFNDESLGIPSFSSSRQNRQQFLTRSKRSFSPITKHNGSQGFTSDRFSSFGNNRGGFVGGSIHENRARTSSAVSLPAISHTYEEFALDSYVSNPSKSTESIQEHYASSLAGKSENLVTTSGFYGNCSDAMSSSSLVFRDEYGVLPAPPGLGPNNGLASASLMDPMAARVGIVDGLPPSSENNRVRAATWVAGSSVCGANTGLYDSMADDTLSGDLASILKLSGAEEKDENSGLF